MAKDKIFTQRYEFRISRGQKVLTGADRTLPDLLRWVILNAAAVRRIKNCQEMGKMSQLDCALIKKSLGIRKKRNDEH